MALTQYQEELNKTIEKGEDIKKFEEDWFKRACQSYRLNIKSREDIHKFRSGGIHIKK